jgi:hypothetical protein
MLKSTPPPDLERWALAQSTIIYTHHQATPYVSRTTCPPLISAMETGLCLWMAEGGLWVLHLHIQRSARSSASGDVWSHEPSLAG